MSENSKATVAITADNSQFIAKLAETQEAMRASFEQMKGTVEGLVGTFEKINVAMAAVTAVLAGGGAFKEAIETTVNLTKDSMALGKQFGISATDASVLKVALNSVFVSQDQLSTAGNKITQALKKNESAFTDLGVATRDANGNFRGTFDIMQDVNTRLLQFKEGTDRNIEGVKIYGRSWAEVAPTLKLTNEVMEEARIKASQLGLVVGEENVRQTKAYRSAMNDVHEVIEAVEKAIGDALLPILTSFGQWIADNGVVIVNAFRAGLYALGAAFSYLKEAVNVAADFIAGYLADLGARVSRIINTMMAVLHGDWSGAKQAWSSGTKDIEATNKAMWDKIEADTKAGIDERTAMLEKMAGQQTAIMKRDSGETSDGGDERQSKSRVSVWETALQEIMVAEQAAAAQRGQLIEFSKQQELDYWKQKLALTESGTEEERQVRAKVAQDELAIQKQTLEGSLTTLKNQADSHKNNLAARLADEMKYADAVKQVYGEDSKNYAEAQKTILDTKRRMVDQQRQIAGIDADAERTAQLTEIQNAEATAKEKYSIGALNLQQLIALERQYEAQKYALAQEDLAARLNLLANDPDRNPVEYERLLKEVEAVAQQHNAAMSKINQQAAQDDSKLYRDLTRTLSSSFSQAFQGIINGTQTMGQAVRSVFKNLLGTIIQFFADWAAKALAQHIMVIAQNKQEALSNAAVAATGAGKSAADIPYVGWILAAGAMASVFSAAMGYSAEGGFDIPGNLAPVTQLHPNEMVLPAKQADVIRQLADDPDGGGGTQHVHLNVSRYGSFFMAHQDDFVDAIKHMVRNGKLSVTNL